MRTHTFYLTEAQRSNVAWYLGLSASKLREEMHRINLQETHEDYQRMINDAEKLQRFFEISRGSTSR